jgi:hypothetical protein
MRALSRIVACWRNLFRKRNVEQELSDELAHAFEGLVEKKIQEGMSEVEARRRAAIELGGVEQLKEKVREGQRSQGWLLYRKPAARCALRRADVVEKSRIHGDGRCHACPGDRRQHCGV